MTCFQHQRLVDSSASARAGRNRVEGGCLALRSAAAGGAASGEKREAASGAVRAFSTRHGQPPVGTEDPSPTCSEGFSLTEDGANVPWPRALSAARGSVRVEPRVGLPDTDTDPDPFQ